MTGPILGVKESTSSHNIQTSQLMDIYTNTIDFPLCLLKDPHINTSYTSIGSPINQVIGRLIGSSKDISLVNFDFPLRILRGFSTLGFKS